MDLISDSTSNSQFDLSKNLLHSPDQVTAPYSTCFSLLQQYKKGRKLSYVRRRSLKWCEISTDLQHLSASFSAGDEVDCG